MRVVRTIMIHTKQQEVRLLLALTMLLAGLVCYRVFTAQAPLTAPLAFPPGTKASSPVRRGLQPHGGGQDALTLLLERRVERYPGMARDLFRTGAPKPRPAEVKRAPVVTAPTPTVPVKTAAEIAADAARADLSTFRFLGYLTDKDSSLFLAKNGELFIAKSGDTLLRNYKVKSAGKDFVVLLDTATGVEVRVELTGGGGAK
jgi:hypothetical protein